MPTITIYVPRDLAEKVREYEVPVSATCQAALARKVRAYERNPDRVEAARANGRSRQPAGRAS